MRKLWLLLALAFFCVSCLFFPVKRTEPPAEATSRTEPLTPSASQSITLTISPYPTKTDKPRHTPSPSETIQATATNTKYPTQDLTRAIAKNEVAVVADNDVEIEILRIFISDRVGLTYLGGQIFEGKQSVFEIIFRVTNNRDSAVRIDFFQTQVWVNETQIDFGDYRQGPGPVGYWFIDDDFFGDAYVARSSEMGGLIVGIDQPAWDQVHLVRVEIPPAFDIDGRAVTGDFSFEVDASEWGFEPLPEELEDLPRQGGVY